MRSLGILFKAVCRNPRQTIHGREESELAGKRNFRGFRSQSRSQREESDMNESPSGKRLSFERDGKIATDGATSRTNRVPKGAKREMRFRDLVEPALEANQQIDLKTK
jgi:hypothetical protein